MKLYTVRDATIGKYFTKLFMLHNDAQANRMFQHAVLGGDQNMTDNPDDYTLYRVGAYDDESGIPIGHDPERICTGVQAVRQGLMDRERLANLQKEITEIKDGENHATH